MIGTAGQDLGLFTPNLKLYEYDANTLSLENLAGGTYKNLKLGDLEVTGDLTAKTGRSATYVIAASDAPAHVKAQADITLTASQDLGAVVNAAIALGYKSISLTEGTFTLAVGLTTSSGVDITISGSGRDATTITLVNGANITMLTVAGARNTLKDFTLDGNSANQASGSGITITSAYDLTIDRVNFKDIKDIGLNSDNVTDKLNFWFNDVYIYQCGQIGAYFRHMAGIVAKGLIISGCGTQGHLWDNMTLYQSLECSFTNCVFDVSNRMGVNISDSQKITIIASYLGGNYEEGISIHGDYFAGSNSEGNIITGNTFNGNGTGNVLYSDLLIEPTTALTGLIISNNQFSHMDARAGIGIQLIGSINNAVIEGNTLTAYEGSTAYTTPIKVSAFTGTGTIIKNNIGYIAPGEVRTASGALATGAANAISFAYHNAELQDCLAIKVTVEVTGAGGAGSLLQVGIADDAVGTGLGSEFFTGLDLNTPAIYDSWNAGDTGVQTKWIFLDDNASATNGWIVGKILVNPFAGAGKYYIEVIGR